MADKKKTELIEELKIQLAALTHEELVRLAEYIRLNPSGNPSDASPSR